MAKNLFRISLGLLIVLFSLHFLNAAIWGNWDQEGTGSLGFWHVFWGFGARIVWLYGLLVLAAIAFGILIGPGKTKRNERY